MRVRRWRKIWLLGIILYLILPATALANTEQAAHSPITIEADNLHYDEKTGLVTAEGNVHIYQNALDLRAAKMEGNTGTGEIKATGSVKVAQDKNTFSADVIHYNYRTRTGSLVNGRGNLEGLLVTGQALELQTGQYTVTGASVTKCPAIVPDYKVTAKKMVIYPGDKLIAYDAAFWIKNIRLFTIPKYQKKLTEKEQSSMPQIGYNSKDGWYIRQEQEIPINQSLAGVLQLGYYENRGFESQIGLAQEEKDYKISLMQGARQIAAGDWLYLRPELAVTYFAKPIGKTPLMYSVQAETGRIEEEETGVDARRDNIQVNVAHKPIVLDAKNTLYLGTAYRRSWYATGDELEVWSHSIKVASKVNDRLNVGLGYYNNNQRGQTPFDYDDPGTSDLLVSEVSYQLDRLWNVGVVHSYDVRDHHFDDIDYTLTRNLHCFEAQITYREKRDEWYVKFRVINW